VVSPTQQDYRLKSATIAVEVDGGKEVMFMLPSQAVVTLLEQLTAAMPPNHLVNVQWTNRKLRMFAADIQERGEPI
jgi:hypothetical protein